MRHILLATSIILGTTISASAQSVDPASPFSLVSKLQKMGYRAELDTDSGGDPRVGSAIEGIDYRFWFYGCKDNQNCTGWNLLACFDVNDGLSMSKVNNWNQNKLVGRVFVDEENDPCIDYFVAAEGGLSSVTFERVLERWEVAIDEFKDHIGW